MSKDVKTDLRESGAIEQDADIILFPWREDDSVLENVTLTVAKCRNGKTGDVKMRWEPHSMSFLADEPRIEDVDLNWEEFK